MIIKAETRTPFYGKRLSFSVGKEKNFNKINKEDLVEVKGLYMDKNTGRIYFVLDDEAYVEDIVLVERREK